jgi:hypothetical protein
MSWAVLTGTVNIGGSPITSYELMWNQGTTIATWITYKGFTSDDTSTSVTITSGITAGESYLFKIRAKNAVGWGPYSSIITIIPSSVPS